MSLQLIDLLQNGYFPIELPPPFNTHSFATITTQQSLNALTAASAKPYYSPMASHNLVRAGGLRRNLSLPNPKHYLKLANEIVTNWAAIETAASRSKYSLTKPKTGQPLRAVVPQHNLNERTEHIAELYSTSKFVLKADITRFFPSIYTHSIPWAFLGKNTAKTMHTAKTLGGTWQDNIDMLSRSINNNQTVGIPIGPDTSRILAEVILGEIDSLLASKYKKIKGIRFIDDYQFGFQTYAEAENVLSFLQYLLNDYELGLNPNKTKIISLPSELEQTWTSELRTFLFRHKNAVSQKNDLIRYFDRAYKLMKENPDDGILKYAIARLRSEEIIKENWKLFENILCNCILIEPSCLPQVCDQLVYYIGLGIKLNKTKWSQNLNMVVTDRVPLGHSSEAAWAMWIMKILKIKLSANSAKVINFSDDSIVTLMGIGMASTGFAAKTYFANLQQYINPQYLYEQQWLLCYQANFMNFFGVNHSQTNLGQDAFFNILAQNNVSFFDITATPTTPVRNVLPIGGSGGGGGY